MENSINLVLLKTSGYIGWAGDVALEEAKVWVGVEDAMIIQRRAIVEFVETDDAILGIS